MKLIDLSGRRFNRLVVIRRSSVNTTAGKPRWLCVCDCGCEVLVSGEDLRSHHQKSCGCLRAEAMRVTGKNRTIHGHSKLGNKRYGSPEYLSWQSMIARCTNPRATAYNRYGGVGVTICDRWLESFQNFLEDMGPRPNGKTLDRYPDPYGDYEPGNCRWATSKEQRVNQRKLIMQREHLL